MTTTLPVPSPTGRLTVSEPELQYFPGTREALAQSRRLKAAAAQIGEPFVSSFNYSDIEARAIAAELDDYLKTPVQAL